MTEGCNANPYRTIRYVKANIIQEHIANSKYLYDPSVKTKIEGMSGDAMVGVRLRINTPIYIERLIEIGKEDLSILIEDIDPLKQ